MSIFTRASMYANLSPAERALLRFLGTLLLGALVSAAQAVFPLLSSVDPTNLATVPWAAVAHTFLVAFVIAVGAGINKYHSAQGDPPLPPAHAYAATLSTEPPASTLAPTAASSGGV